MSAFFALESALFFLSSADKSSHVKNNAATAIMVNESSWENDIPFATDQVINAAAIKLIHPARQYVKKKNRSRMVINNSSALFLKNE